jgi:uncharacterized protein
MREDNFKRFEIPLTKNSEVALNNEILRVLVGSSITGITAPNSEQDYDYNSVFIEPIDYVVGLKRIEHFTWRSKPEGIRSEAGDVDYSAYSLRKFISLAMAGNPSILMLLFAPSSNIEYVTQIGHEIKFMSEYIASKKAGARFLGYLESQEQRIVGEIKGHMPKRPELIQQFGYDTKYAAHALRLGFQGVEYLETGRMTLPIPPDPGNYLRAVRAGEYSLGAVVADLANIKSELKKAIEASPLPEEPDYMYIEKWLIDVHQYHWSGMR